MARQTVLLIGLLWILGLIQVLFPTPQVSTVMVGLLACVAIIALPQATWNEQLLCAFLVVSTVSRAHFYDKWATIEGGLTRAAIFPAFLATIVLLRATADQRPEIGVARRLFTALDRERRDSGLVVGGFLVGSILQVGVFAILSTILVCNTHPRV